MSPLSHRELVNGILANLGTDPRVRLHKNVVGLFRTPNGLTVRVGVKGSADIEGIRRDGKYVAIECKVGRDFQRPEQIAYMNMIRKFGGVYVLAHEIKDAEGIFAGLSN